MAMERERERERERCTCYTRSETSPPGYGLNPVALAVHHLVHNGSQDWSRVRFTIGFGMSMG